MLWLTLDVNTAADRTLRWVVTKMTVGACMWTCCGRRPSLAVVQQQHQLPDLRRGRCSVRGLSSTITSVAWRPGSASSRVDCVHASARCRWLRACWRYHCPAVPNEVRRRQLATADVLNQRQWQPPSQVRLGRAVATSPISRSVPYSITMAGFAQFYLPVASALLASSSLTCMLVCSLLLLYTLHLISVMHASCFGESFQYGRCCLVLQTVIECPRIRKIVANRLQRDISIEATSFYTGCLW